MTDLRPRRQREAAQGAEEAAERARRRDALEEAQFELNWALKASGRKNTIELSDEARAALAPKPEPASGGGSQGPRGEPVRPERTRAEANALMNETLRGSLFARRGGKEE